MAVSVSGGRRCMRIPCASDFKLKQFLARGGQRSGWRFFSEPEKLEMTFLLYVFVVLQLWYTLYQPLVYPPHCWAIVGLVTLPPQFHCSNRYCLIHVSRFLTLRWFFYYYSEQRKRTVEERFSCIIFWGVSCFVEMHRPKLLVGFFPLNIITDFVII